MIMPQNCFEEIIGIRGLCAPGEEPTSGLYVQDLPFIDMKTVNAVISEELTAAQYIRNKLNYCVNSVKNTLNLRLQPYFRKRSVVESKIIGAYTENLYNLPQPAQAGIRAGVIIRILDSTPYELNLSRINLWTTNFTGPVTIKVHNLITGQEIDSFDIDVTPNTMGYIDINRKFQTDGQRAYYLVSYLTTGINSVQSTISGFVAGCSTCAGRTGYISRYAILNAVTIADSAAKNISNLEYPGNTAGLSVQYTLNCSTDAFMCTIKDQMAWPILHKLGAEICRDVINGTHRLNSVTTIDIDKAEALKADFEAQYIESMDVMLQSMSIPENTCFRCLRQVRSFTKIP